ncbi:MAG: hypothetical protein JWL80_231 [Parcubacteria group bacterium]|nr:hypothetical protein [Parcubacteria group bacterium]
MKSIITIPGLGGHPSVFSHYRSLLPEYSLGFIDLINLSKGEQLIIENIHKEDHKVIILANCYGILPVLRNIKDLGYRIEKLIIIEPFFTEFYWWQSLAKSMARMFLGLSHLTDELGLTRKHFKKDVDYIHLSRYPLWIQPFFDLSYQTTTEYLEKLYDISSFTLPEQISIPTLLIFSPGGYSQNPVRRNKIISHFSHATVTEVGKKTHNIVTVSEKEITSAINNWLQL